MTAFQGSSDASLAPRSVRHEAYLHTIRVRTQEPCRYARPQLGEHFQNQLRRQFAMYSFNKNPNAFAMWKWERETTRNSQPKCSLCSGPPKLLSCTVPKPSHLVVVNSRAALPFGPSPPSSSPQSRAHAWYTLGDCPCRGSTLRRSQAMMYWGRSAGCVLSAHKGSLSLMPVVSHLCILVKMAATSYVGLQRFCKMSKQSSPVPYTLGWNIWLINLTPGGLFG